MMDDRRLREIAPSKRGFRFVGKIAGRLVKANVPYLVITAAGVITRHYTEPGARKRVAILRTSGVGARGWGWKGGGGWAPLLPLILAPDGTRSRRPL